MNVFDLFARLGLDSSEYDRGLENSEKKGSDFGKKLSSVIGTGAKIAGAAITATAGATVAMGKKFIDAAGAVSSMGDSIGDNAAKMGISTKAYQEWDYILQRAGSSIDAMKPSMKTLANAAVNGSDAFKELGISQEEVASLNQEELFARTIQALQGVEDTTQRTALASKLLGRGATELGAVFDMTAEETEQARQKMYELGNYMGEDAISASDKFQDTMADMNDSIAGMKTRLMVDFLPSLTTAMDGLSKIFSGSNVEGGLAQIEQGISGLAQNITEKAPQIFQIGGTILNALVSSISSNLPILLNAAVPVILELGNSLIQNAPSLISAVISVIGTIGSALGDPNNLQNIIQSAVAIITTISDSISQNAETVIPAIVEIIMQMLTALTDEKTLMPLLSAGLSVIQAVVSGILKSIPVLIRNLPTIISNITNFLVKSTPLIITAAIQLLMGLIRAIPTIIVELGKALPQILKTINDGLGDGVKGVMEVGKNLIRGLWNGISNMGKWIGEKIKGFGKGVVDNLKSFFGIHSPSTLFRDEIGQMLALGLGEGFSDEMGNVSKDMVASAKDVSGDIANAMTLDDMQSKFADATSKASSLALANGFSTASGNSTPSRNIGNVTINVYAQEGQDIRELAKQVSQEIQNLIADKEKAYA